MALEAWERLLGHDAVRTGSDLERYRKSTSGFARHIAGVVQPRTQDQVVETVKIASRWRVPLYPVSTGRNWGYGCALPAVDGCVIVDLSRMNRLELDERLGLATLEPGVTQ